MREPNVRRGKTPFGSRQMIELSVINFVFNHLAAWRDDPKRSPETAETKLSAQLSVYLDSASRHEGYPFLFQREQPQGERRDVDIVANPDRELVASGYFDSPYDEILVFEAKRLPTPDAGRQREYVSGGNAKMSGGIQRFKACVHGKGHSTAAMIGYIQEYIPSFFYKEINTWIIELCEHPADSVPWAKDELLGDFIEQPDGTARAVSAHQRTQAGPITMHHLWVVMQPQ
ncbi:hypothetical protein LJC23_01870 [Desulfovibrio sp. OttesenSCG-928-I05]|nr:hypothetical protein [Desulfovibrio sp. OttesenSCG-928-I05]